MPSFDEQGNPVYQEWTQEMKDALVTSMTAIPTDDLGGVDRAKLRVFYPMLGWNDLQKGIDALIADGRLESKITSVGGRPVEVFVVKEA
jgi:hypothetical protein